MSLRRWINLAAIIIAGSISTLAFAENSVAGKAAKTKPVETVQQAAFSAEQQQAIEKIVHDYLVQNPQVLLEAASSYQRQQQEKLAQNASKTIPEVAQQLFNDPNSPVIGNPKGNVAIVEFFDYQCPHCKDMSATITELLKTDKELRVVLKQLPIFGENSEFAARAALAAQKQNKFVAFHDALMSTRTILAPSVIMNIAQQVGLNKKQLEVDMKDPAIMKEIEVNDQLAKRLKLTGTPAYVIAKIVFDPQSDKIIQMKNPVLIPGAVEQSILAQVIVKVRSDKTA